MTGDDELGRHTRFRHQLRERGERYVLGIPCTTTMRDLEAALPAYQGRGRRPKAPWQSVTEWRKLLHPTAWRRFTVRDGEKGLVEIEIDQSCNLRRIDVDLFTVSSSSPTRERAATPAVGPVLPGPPAQATADGVSW